MKQRPVIYEKHPVSVERKAELKSAGYIIMDEAHKPEGYEAPVVVITGGGDNSELLAALERLGQYKIEHASLEQLIAAAEGNGELIAPEAGELPIRLHEALTSIHALIETTKAERDEWFDAAEALQKQVEALGHGSQQSEADKVAELKAKLDAAGKQYRANASVESLESAVADLSQA